MGESKLFGPSSKYLLSFPGASRTIYGAMKVLLKLKNHWGVEKRQLLHCVVADIDEDFILGRPWLSNRHCYFLESGQLELSSLEGLYQGHIHSQAAQ